MRASFALGFLAVLALAAGCPSSEPGGTADPAAETTPPPPAEGEATAVARTYFTALHAVDWAACADVLHPDSLDEFKRIILPGLLQAARQGEEEAVLQRFEGVSSVDTLAGLPAREFFQRFMTSYVSTRPHNVQMLRTSQTAVLGEVREGNDNVHVVYRMTGQAGLRFEQLGVLQVRRYEGGFKALLSDEVKTVAANPG
jgi:hypothetical protein